MPGVSTAFAGTPMRECGLGAQRDLAAANPASVSVRLSSSTTKRNRIGAARLELRHFPVTDLSPISHFIRWNPVARAAT
jgi:hypothetical protein